MSKEFLPEEIGQSVAQVETVYRYAKSEQVLPLQDPLLEQQYVEAITGYFNYVQRALTDPDVAWFMNRSEVGLWRGDGSSYLVQMEDGVHAIAKVPYSHSHIVCLVTKPTARLVYDTEEILDIGRQGVNTEEEIEKWKTQVLAKYVSQEGSDDWVFGQGADRLNQFLHLYAYRTMRATDLLMEGVMPGFVRGVGNTFEQLKRAAEEEAAVKFNGIEDIKKIKLIVEAFNQANSVLNKVLDSSSLPETQPQVLERRKSRRSS